MTYDPERDLFGNYKNSDGTYNGLKLMAEVSGIPEDEVKAIWEKVKQDKLK